MKEATLVVTGASEIRTCHPEIGEGPTGRIERGALAADGERIVWVGEGSDLATEVEITDDTVTIDVPGRAVVPGFVDAHTHMVFAGTRPEEFAARAAGRPYEAGGILVTVEATKAASTDDLLEATRSRADVMLAHGTTTAEAKSGYALDEEGEARLLEVLTEIHETHLLDLEITFCGAHAIPSEHADDPDAFIEAICEMTPRLAERARFADVFCDEGAFTPDQSRRVLKAGLEAGLIPRIHANELAPSGGAAVAAELEAASADHLIHLTEEEAKALARAGCVGVLCPATALGLGRFPDAAMMLEAGMTLALASDLNPGSAYTENLQFAVDIATRAMGMGPEEALLAITSGAADSLRRDDIGRIVPGCLADLVVLASDTALDLGYHAGVNLAEMVVKRGVATP